MWPHADVTYECVPSDWTAINASWLHSQLYLDLSTCDRITQEACNVRLYTYSQFRVHPYYRQARADNAVFK